MPSFFWLLRKLIWETEMDACAARFNPSMLWNFDKVSKRQSHKLRRLLLSEANCTLGSVTTKEIVTCRCTFSFTFPIQLSQSNFKTNYERLQTRLSCSNLIFATSLQDHVLFRLICTTANRDTKVKTQETFRMKMKPRIISSVKGSLLFCSLEICIDAEYPGVFFFLKDKWWHVALKMEKRFSQAEPTFFVSLSSCGFA